MCEASPAPLTNLTIPHITTDMSHWKSPLSTDRNLTPGQLTTPDCRLTPGQLLTPVGASLLTPDHGCESPAGWNLPEIQNGLMCTPRHVSEHLQWLTQQGQDLYSERKSTVDVFQREVTALTKAVKAISHQLSDKLVVIDLGAGLSDKTIAMFNCMLDGHSNRRICYIPVDLNEIIMDWSSHLEKHHAVLNEHIIAVKPVILDMLYAVKNTEELVKGTGCEEFEIVYSLFGPTSTILHNTYFTDLVRSVHDVLKPRGRGGFVFTYLPSHAGIEARINKEYYSKLDMAAIMKCVLLGLNKVVGAKVDPDLFEYEKKFISDNTTPGVEGKWSGFAIYATAKEDMQFFCKKLQMMIPLKCGQQIRLSEDIVKAHYYEDRYIRSLANTAGLDVYDIWQEPTELISSVYMMIHPHTQCKPIGNICINTTQSPRHG